MAPWRDYIEWIIIGVTVFVFFTFLMVSETKRQVEYCKDSYPPPEYARKDEKKPTRDKARLIKNREQPLQSAIKTIDCNQPYGDDEYKACQEWRAAKATSDQACIAHAQLWVGMIIGGLGIIGLVGTILYAARTAKSAADAVRATVEIERAWLTSTTFQTGIAINCVLDGLHIREGMVVQFHWINSGRSPATRAIRKIQKRIVPRGEPVPEFAVEMEDQPSVAIVGPNQTFRAPDIILNDAERESLDPARANRNVLYVFARAEYECMTATARTCVTSVCVAIDVIGYEIKNGQRYPSSLISFAGKQNFAT